MKTDSGKPKGSGPVLLINAGASAAAQGLVRSALLTKLLPCAGAVSFLVGLFGRKRGTEIRPGAGVSQPQNVGMGGVSPGYRSDIPGVSARYTSRIHGPPRSRRHGATTGLAHVGKEAS